MQIVHLICREKRCQAWNTSSILVEQSKTRNEHGSGTQIGLHGMACDVVAGPESGLA
jgi:hypothetical protein